MRATRGASSLFSETLPAGEQFFTLLPYFVNRDGCDWPRIARDDGFISARMIERGSGLHDAVVCLPWPPLHGVGDAKNHDAGTLHGCRQMGGAGIISHEDARGADQRDQLANIQLRIQHGCAIHHFAANFSGNLVVTSA